MAIAAACKGLGASPRVVLAVWGLGAVWVTVRAWMLTRRERDVAPRPVPYAVWAWGALILVVATFLRGWAIDTVPRYVHCDEGTMTFAARTLYESTGVDWFSVLPNAGSYSIMQTFYGLVGLGTFVLGTTLGGARLSDVALGTLSVVFLFDAVRRVSTLRTAVVASLLLAVNHCHIAYSRIASGYIQTAFVVTAVLALFARTWSAPSVFAAVLLGLATALGIQTYPASTAVLPLLVAAGGGLWLVRPERRRALLVPALVVAITCATASAPFAVSMWNNREQMALRSRDINIFSPAKMAQLKRETYHTDSATTVVLNQAWNALRGFHVGADHQPQYGINQPMADRYTAALLVPGVVLAVLGLRQFLAVNALVFAIGYLLVGLGMQYAPGFNRTTGALPPAMILAAIAAVQCCSTLVSGTSRPAATVRVALLGLIVVVAAAANLRLYLVDYPGSLTYGDAASEAAWAARRYAGQYRIHFVNWSLPGQEGLRLIIADLPLTLPPLADSVEYVQSVPVGPADLFIFALEDTAAIDALRERFPAARMAVWNGTADRGPALLLAFVDTP